MSAVCFNALLQEKVVAAPSYNCNFLRKFIFPLVSQRSNIRVCKFWCKVSALSQYFISGCRPHASPQSTTPVYSTSKIVLIKHLSGFCRQSFVSFSTKTHPFSFASYVLNVKGKMRPFSAKQGCPAISHGTPPLIFSLCNN